MSDYAYFVLRVPRNPQICHIKDRIQEIKRHWLLGKGEAMGANFPDDAKCFMSTRWSGMKLADFIPNNFSWLLVSSKARAILESEKLKIEWLPVKLHNKKKREVEKPYAIANVLGTIDCVDLEKSEYDRSALTPEVMVAFLRLLLIHAKIPEHATLFRIKEKPTIFIIRSDLAKKLVEAEVTGFTLLQLNTAVVI